MIYSVRTKQHIKPSAS